MVVTGVGVRGGRVIVSGDVDHQVASSKDTVYADAIEVPSTTLPSSVPFSDHISSVHYLTGRFGGIPGGCFFEGDHHRITERLNDFARALMSDPISVFPGPRVAIRTLKLEATAEMVEDRWALVFDDFLAALPVMNVDGDKGPVAGLQNLCRELDKSVPLCRQRICVSYSAVCRQVRPSACLSSARPPAHLGPPAVDQVARKASPGD